MPKHGTAQAQWELGQQNEVLVAVVRAMPLALQEVDPKQLLASLEGRGQEIEQALAEMFAVFLKNSSLYPADGEEFELTLDGDNLATDPIAMVRHDGYNQPESWKYKGKKLMTGKLTGSFKLVSVGYCPDLDDVRQKLTQHGEVPEGQWREAFKASYPKPDGDGPVGIADPSWVNPNGGAFFPYVDSGGGSRFGWTGSGFDDDWRWLVRVSK